MSTTTQTREASVDRALMLCEELLASHLTSVEHRFGAVALGVIDLPALGSARIVAEQVRVGAAIYWAREIEATGLLKFVEALARGLLRGSIQFPIAGSVRRILTYYRTPERFDFREREALYRRVLGSIGREDSFEQDLHRLMRALVAVGRQAADQGIAHLEARTRVVAQAVGERLSKRSVGLASFAARDIIGQIRTCLSILRAADVERALGGGSPIAIIQRHAPLVLGNRVMVHKHVTRANEGVRVLTWIADHAPELSEGSLHLDRDAPVIRHAEAWLASRNDG